MRSFRAVCGRPCQIKNRLSREIFDKNLSDTVRVYVRLSDTTTLTQRDLFSKQVNLWPSN